jgi:choline dehydrogenase-like flavoprotein
MLLNRGAAPDYDAWEKLGNPGWGWDGLYPYFIKSSKFDAPNPATVEEFNMTWGEESFGNGPIHLSMSSFQYPGLKYQRKGLMEMGAPASIDSCGGDAYGVIWYPTALDNATATRSYAVNQYWDPNKERHNLHLLTGWRVDEVLFDDDKKATGIIMSERTTADQPTAPERVTVNAIKEVIVSAGGLHSPQVLQRSGIGGKALLEEAGIKVLVDLPGVGTNLQDHASVGMSWQCKW